MMLCLAIAAALPFADMATNAVAARTAAADPADCLSRFLDYPPSRGKLGFPRCLFQDPFPANPDFWLKDVDFSCASPWNDAYGALRAGTAISRRHVVFAAHYSLGRGDKMTFVDAAGETCRRRVVATHGIVGTDIAVGLLDEELPPSVRPAKILPPDYERYVGDGRGLPVVTFNQREQALLTELNGIPTNATWRSLGCHVPRDERQRRFRDKLVGGDSGNPAFLLIGTEPILLYCLHYGGCGTGPALHRHRAEIQRAMDALCLGYRLESFDFAAHPLAN